ncbi:MAG: hypothetical protein FWD71_19560, partial [Oscillospiraceae bacterium]|nr:hypothetical protein [Oscillospiraceae bacterium]
AGGGIYIDGSTSAVTISGGKISGNSATFGGAICINNGTVTMTGGKISGNSANSQGGGLYLAIVGIFDMKGGELSGNTSTGYGGGIYTDSLNYYNPTSNGTNAYSNIGISKTVVVSGNTAGFITVPPSNAANFQTRATRPFDGNLLDNDNINYKNPNITTYAVTVYYVDQSDSTIGSPISKRYAVPAKTAFTLPNTEIPGITDYVYADWKIGLGGALQGKNTPITIPNITDDNTKIYLVYETLPDPFDCITYEKNAYINSSLTAQNGTANQYRPVHTGDTILYELKINNLWQGSLIPPSISNPNFQPKADMPARINFINGSFETPLMPAGSVYFNPSTTTPGIGWKNTAENIIEIQITPPPSAPQYPVFAKNIPDGNQYGELNALKVGTLYQDIATVPGAKVYWEFYHGANGILTGQNNTDIINFLLGPPSGPVNFTRQVSDSYVGGSANYVWGHYTGSYIVPAGQTTTRFAFQSISTTSGQQDTGNYLDGVRLYTSSYIDLTKSNDAVSGEVQIGDIVKYTILAQNKGESDASNVRITDALPAGTELVPGTVRIDGMLTDNFNYNAAARELGINIGAGSTASAGGLFKGDSSFSSDCGNSYTVTFQIKITGNEIAEDHMYANQAMVTYQDRYDNVVPAVQLTNYSNIDVLGINIPDLAMTLTDVLPAGLTYISNTDANGSVFNITGQTCHWLWNSLPYGETVVTVLVRVDMGTQFINHATLETNGESRGTNYTYHELFPTTSLTISKAVKGDFGDTTKQFEFMVTFEDANKIPLTGQFQTTNGTLPLADGTANFTLKHGQSITINNVPLDCYIQIVETPDSNYKSSFIDSYTGTLVDKNDTTILHMTADRTFTFINERQMPPPTGIDAGNTTKMLMLPIFALLAGLTLFITRRFIAAGKRRTPKWM